MQIMNTPRHLTLYRRLEGSAQIELLFSACESCDALMLGTDHYGCAACGGERLRVTARPGEGRLICCVQLHADIVPGVKPPAAIGEIELAPGVIEEALMCGNAEQFRPGMKVVACAVDAGDGTFECRFSGALA